MYHATVFGVPTQRIHCWRWWWGIVLTTHAIVSICVCIVAYGDRVCVPLFSQYKDNCSLYCKKKDNTNAKLRRYIFLCMVMNDGKQWWTVNWLGFDKLIPTSLLWIRDFEFALRMISIFHFISFGAVPFRAFFSAQFGFTTRAGLNWMM